MKINDLSRIKFNILGPLLVITSQIFSQNVSAANIIVLNTGFSDPITNDQQTGFGDQVLKIAFKELGYTLVTERLPAERALINANHGIDDGDLLRIGGLGKQYPNLIQVPEKIIDMDVVLFAKRKRGFKISGWGGVKGHSIAIMTGWKVFELNLDKSVQIIKTDNVDQLFTMLTNDRTDFVGYSRWSGLKFLKNAKFDDIELLEPPLLQTGLYTYLNKKHKALVPKLAKKIKEMKKDGTINELYIKLLKPLLN